MIVNSARITVRPEKRTEFFQTIADLVDRIRAAKGCRDFQVYVDTMDENSSLLIGEWETESDLENSLRSNEFAILRGAVSVLTVRRDEVRALVYAGGRKTVPPKTGMTAVSSHRMSEHLIN
jgi:quinol monooxygenase YgiN